jgi:hypothetical protein
MANPSQKSLPSDIADIFFTIYSVLSSRRAFTEPQLLDTLRKQVDPYVYAYLEKRYGPFLESYWKSTQIPKESDKAVVIVERRCHPNLRFCLRNAAFFAKGYCIHIVCSKANADFVRHLCEPHLENIHIHTQWNTIGTPEEGKTDYNELLKTTAFWQLFKEEHLLLMETDTYLRKPIPESIYQYDYVASKWPWLPDQPGGGGLSYRKRSAMLRICNIYTPDMDPMQDSYASNGVKNLGFKTPSMEESTNYFCECIISNAAVGTHQWWTFLSAYTPTEVVDIIQIMTTLFIF